MSVRPVLFAVLLAMGALAGSVSSGEEKWAGVDETVVGKFAEEGGRPPQPPLFDWLEGDMALFLFLSAGIIGGFVMGYYCRHLFPPKSSKDASLNV